jgi:hypothetical protein
MHHPSQHLVPSLWAKDDAVQDMMHMVLFRQRTPSMCIRRVEAIVCIKNFSPHLPPKKKQLFILAIDSQALSRGIVCKLERAGHFNGGV